MPSDGSGCCRQPSLQLSYLCVDLLEFFVDFRTSFQQILPLALPDLDLGLDRQILIQDAGG